MTRLQNRWLNINSTTNFCLRSTLRSLPAEALTSMMAFNRKRVLAPRTAKPNILRMGIWDGMGHSTAVASLGLEPEGATIQAIPPSGAAQHAAGHLVHFSPDNTAQTHSNTRIQKGF